jgi:hypothetical protein
MIRDIFPFSHKRLIEGPLSRSWSCTQCESKLINAFNSSLHYKACIGVQNVSIWTSEWMNITLVHVTQTVSFSSLTLFRTVGYCPITWMRQSIHDELSNDHQQYDTEPGSLKAPLTSPNQVMQRHRVAPRWRPTDERPSSINGPLLHIRPSNIP